MKREKMKDQILKTMLIIFEIFLLLGFGVLVGNFFGTIQDYTYLKIGDHNREQITTLLKQQESKMFLVSEDSDIDKCILDAKRLEVVFRFPDGEDYTIYCNDKAYHFSLDDANYDLPMYMKKYGRLGLRIKN